MINTEELATKNRQIPLTETQLAYLMGRDTSFELGGVATHAYYEYLNTLDIVRFEKAFNMEISYQPMLRAIFSKLGKQIILDEVPYYKFEVIDIRGMSFTEQTEYIEKEREKYSHHIFPENEWPLFKVKVAQLGENKNYIFFSIDLLIADGSSIVQMFDEIVSFYQDENVIFPLIKKTFEEYVTLEIRQKEKVKYEVDKEYWLGKLDAFPVFYNIPAPKVESNSIPRFKRLIRELDIQEYSKIKKISYIHKVIPSVLLCTIYSYVLGYWGNQNKIPVNVTISNKNKYDGIFKNLIGDFTTIMPVGIEIEENIWKTAVNVQADFIEAYKHLSYSGYEFLGELSNKHDLKKRAIMPIVFTYISNESSISQGILGTPRYSISQTPQIYLDCQIIENSDNISVSWDYSEQIWDENIMERMFEQFLGIVKKISNKVQIDDPNEIETILSLNDNSKKIIEQYNDTEKEVSEMTLCDIIYPNFKKYSEKEAIRLENKYLTYSQLDRLSDVVMDKLIALGVGAGDYIGIYATKSLQTIVNIIGVVKCGAAYVPINPDYPSDRVSYIIENCDCKIYLIENEMKTELYESKINPFVKRKSAPYDPAYVIYTSGSTGSPKGVVIRNDAVCNTILDINRRFNINSEDNFIGISSLCFDLSVYDIFGALSVGARLTLIPDARDTINIVEKIDKDNITVWNSVPAIMELCIDEYKQQRKGKIQNYWQIDSSQILTVTKESELRVIMLSGDWIPISMPDKIRAVFPDSCVYSLGGATEASIWSVYYPVEKVDNNWKSIPYGYPLTNQKLYILNSDKKVTPLGIEGEIYISGRGLADSYLKDMKKTKESFFLLLNGERVYRTGDYGIMHEQGYIEFKGRKDTQVKINGFRIELTEIENILEKHILVNKALVVIHNNNLNKKILCGYIVCERMPDKQELIDFVKNYLPGYMIPQVYIRINEIPLTTNGKVNKKLLPDPEGICKLKKCSLPKTSMEKKIGRIWGEVIGGDSLDIYDNFFEVGGDSLLMIKLVNYINDEIGVKIGFSSFFQNPTISQLSKLVEELLKN